MKVHLFAAATLLIMTFGHSPAARGGLFIYTESFTASGSLGGAQFTDKNVVLTVFGDTSNIFSTPVVAEVSATLADATVGVARLPTATFNDVLNVFDVYSPNFGGIFGISDANSPNFEGDILDVQAAPFLTYDLISPIGPIFANFADPDPSTLNNPNGTSDGDLIFTSVGSAVTVNVVSLASVPEPASVATLGIGLVGVLGYGWWMRFSLERRRGCNACRFRLTVLDVSANADIARPTRRSPTFEWKHSRR